MILKVYEHMNPTMWSHCFSLTLPESLTVPQLNTLIQSIVDTHWREDTNGEVIRLTLRFECEHWTRTVPR